MEETFSEILEDYMKRFLPLLCSVCLLLVFYIPIYLPLSRFLRPDIGIICVYFWALYRQDLFGSISAFLFGLIADSLSAVPIGLNIFVFMFVFIAGSTSSSYVNMKPFTVSWIGFTVVSFLAFVIKWLLASIFYSRFLAFGGIFAGYLATVCFYPLVARLNIFIQNRCLADEELVYE